MHRLQSSHQGKQATPSCSGTEKCGVEATGTLTLLRTRETCHQRQRQRLRAALPADILAAVFAQLKTKHW